MKVLITGGAGFIGTHVARAILQRGQLTDPSGHAAPVRQLVLADVVAAQQQLPNPHNIELRSEVGDLSDAAFRQLLWRDPPDSVFHLAAMLTAEAESDFGGGLEVNLVSLVGLLELCRANARCPRFVFASSIAAFGGPLPATVDDFAAQTPQTSYGTHKVVTELLLNDYSRHRFIDGRSLRLPIVLLRPGAASPMVSDRVAAIVREPLLGRDVVCPLAPETRIPVTSARCAADALLAVHDLPTEVFGHTRAMNLPALTVTIGEMVESLNRFGDRVGEVTFAPDPALQGIVDSWPKVFVSEFADRHGIRADRSFDEIVDAFLETSRAVD